MIAPEANAEFTAATNEVLESYERSPDQSLPAVCMDGQPVQWVSETHEPLALCGYPPATRESGLGA